MRNVSEKVVDKIEAHILGSIIFFFENCAFYEITPKNIVQQDRPLMTIWCKDI
jgi:aspartyl/asparaginyl-tRNA synthetase